MLPQSTLYEAAQIANVPVEQVIAVILDYDDVTADVRARVQTALKLSQSFHAHTSIARLGAIVPRNVSEDGYLGVLVRGIAAAARESGYELLLHLYEPERRTNIAALLREAEVVGAVIGVPLNDEDMTALYLDKTMPYVFIDHMSNVPDPNALIIEADNRHGVAEVMQHIIELGHRRIGFITGDSAYASAHQRFEVYQVALDAAGIPYDEALVVEGDWTHETAHALTQQLLNLDNPPTAVVGSNDLSALGAMQAAKEAGLTIGDQISIVGFDDIPMAQIVSPSLTTVRQPTHTIGSLAVEMLVKRLRGGYIEEPHLCVKTELIIRESTGWAPDSR